MNNMSLFFQILPKLIIDKQIIDFLINILIILFAIIVVSFFNRKNIKHKIIVGIILGLLSIMLLMNPVVLANGSYYDARTIIFTISGFFFGIISTAIAFIIGATLNIIVDLPGNPLVDISIMLFSGAIAYLLRYILEKKGFKHNIKYFVVSYIINIVNIVLFLIFSTTNTTFTELIIPYLIVFPTITILSLYLLEFNLDFSLLVRNNLQQQKLLKYSLDLNERVRMVILDLDYNYLMFNKTHEDFMKKHLNLNINIGDNYLDKYKEDLEHKKNVLNHLENALRGETIYDEFSYTFGDEEIFISSTYIPIYDKYDKLIGININLDDITEQKENETEMLNLSYRDSLTGLYNRRSLTTKIQELEKEQNLGIIYFDIDGLKFMNDAFGHEDGDKLIVTIVKEIESVIPQDSLVFRFGGDEFIAITKNLTLKRNELLAEKIVSNLSSKKINEISISLSYGVAARHKSENIEDTIKRAEDNMYENKILFSESNYLSNIDNILTKLYEIDPKLETHLENVRKYSYLLGKELGLSDHDLGKINISEELVNQTIDNKKDVLKMKQHVEIGYRILSRLPKYFEIAFDVLTQYENFDGSGYPKRLKGTDIPIKARILRITNTYDFDTLYKGLSKEEALNRLKQYNGIKYDPIILNKFIEVINKKVPN